VLFPGGFELIKTSPTMEFWMVGSITRFIPHLVKELGRYRVSRSKRRTFFAEWNYVKQMSPFDSLFKVVPITCDHTFAPCNSGVKTSSKVSDEISPTDFRISTRSSSPVSKREPRNSAFKSPERKSQMVPCLGNMGDVGQI
jgi:hypothetical protein